VTVVSTGPAPQDLEVYAGDKNEVPLMFKAGNDAWDLTGAVLMAQARATAVDAVVALEATATLTSPENGSASIAWDGEEVRTLLAGAESWVGVWDLQILEAGQTLPRTVLRGKFTAAMDVTRVGP
jgi:hypothetical protein